MIKEGKNRWKIKNQRLLQSQDSINRVIFYEKLLTIKHILEYLWTKLIICYPQKIKKLKKKRDYEHAHATRNNSFNISRLPFQFSSYSRVKKRDAYTNHNTSKIFSALTELNRLRMEYKESISQVF